MPVSDDSPGAVAISSQTVAYERERAMRFGETFRILMQRQQFYVPLTETYLVTPVADRARMLGGASLHPNALRTFLRGESLPTDVTARLLADALGVPRGVVLYAAEYLTLDDLSHYPGPYTTLEAVEEDIDELATLPLAEETKERITADLRASARILRLLDSERIQADWRSAPNDREQVLDLLIELWETPVPPLPTMTVQDERVTLAWARSEATQEAVRVQMATSTAMSTAAPTDETEPLVARAQEAARLLH